MSDSERDAQEVNSPEKQLPLSPAKLAGASGTSATIAAAEVAGARIGRCRWMICALLFFAATLNYLDRQVIATLKPTLQGRHRVDSRRPSYGLARYAQGLFAGANLLESRRYGACPG